MAVRPEIALQGRMTDIGQTFGNALLNVQRMSQLAQQQREQPFRNRLLEAQASTAEAGVPTPQQQFNEEQQRTIKSLAVGARSVLPALKSGNTEEAIRILEKRSEGLRAANIPDNDTREAILMAEINPQGLIQQSEQAIELDRQVNPATRAKGASARAFAPDVDPDTGEVSSVVFDPATQEFTRTTIPGAKQLTPAQESEIAVKETASKERIKLTEKRTSDIKAGLSERNRNAARSGRTLRKALTLAQQADQGVEGATKLRLSRLIPGIDASDEAALDSALKELALEQLQQFKGPTTDFEFGVTESIVGGIGNAKTANIARIKSLTRASWFNQKEFDQFDKHVKKGGDPDAFRFNFGEPISTKKGVFTLQDLQDTAVQNNLTIEETIKRLNR